MRSLFWPDRNHSALPRCFEPFKWLRVLNILLIQVCTDAGSSHIDQLCQRYQTKRMSCNEAFFIKKYLSTFFRCPCVCMQVCHRRKESSSETGSIENENQAGRDVDLAEFRLPEKSESTTVLVGSVNYLKHPISIFARLAEGCLLGNLMEVNVPVRFLFVLLGPEDEQNKYHETGRSIAAMMSDKYFLSLVYNFKVC